MAFQPSPAIQLVVVGGVSGGGETNNVFHSAKDFGAGDFDAADAEILGGILHDMYVELIPWVPPTTSWNYVICTDLRTEGAAQFTVTTDFPVVGTNVSQPVAGQVAALIRWNTDFRGREGRGRSYISGLAETAVNGPSLEGGAHTALEDFAAGWTIGGAVVLSKYKGTQEAVTGSRRLKPVPRAVGVTHQITNTSVPFGLATQRRRGPLAG